MALLPLLMLLLVLANVAVTRSNASGILGFTKQDAGGAIAAAESSGQEAFAQIQAADREGGNVTILTSRFNEALEMLDRAKINMDGGLYDQATIMADIAQQLLDTIGLEAAVLQKRAVTEASNKRMVIILAAPIVVISTTLFSYFLIRFWRRRNIERIMEMKVREVET